MICFSCMSLVFKANFIVMALLDELRAQLIAAGGVGRLFSDRGLTLPKALDGLAKELAASAPWKVRQQARRDLMGYLGAVAQAPEEAGAGAGPGFDAVLIAYWQARDQAPASLPDPTPRHVIDINTMQRLKAGKRADIDAARGNQAAGPYPPSPLGGLPLRPPAKEEQVPESRSIPPRQADLAEPGDGDDEED